MEMGPAMTSGSLHIELMDGEFIDHTMSILVFFELAEKNSYFEQAVNSSAVIMRGSDHVKSNVIIFDHYARQTQREDCHLNLHLTPLQVPSGQTQKFELLLNIEPDSACYLPVGVSLILEMDSMPDFIIDLRTIRLCMTLVVLSLLSINSTRI